MQRVTCKSHASHMQVTCKSHASHMQVTCRVLRSKLEKHVCFCLSSSTLMLCTGVYSPPYSVLCTALEAAPNMAQHGSTWLNTAPTRVQEWSKFNTKYMLHLQLGMRRDVTPILQANVCPQGHIRGSSTQSAGDCSSTVDLRVMGCFD